MTKSSKSKTFTLNKESEKYLKELKKSLAQTSESAVVRASLKFTQIMQ